jgi:hypothetical protein
MHALLAELFSAEASRSTQNAGASADASLGAVIRRGTRSNCGSQLRLLSSYRLVGMFWGLRPRQDGHPSSLKKGEEANRPVRLQARTHPAELAKTSNARSPSENGQRRSSQFLGSNAGPIRNTDQWPELKEHKATQPAAGFAGQQTTPRARRPKQSPEMPRIAYPSER